MSSLLPTLQEHARAKRRCSAGVPVRVRVKDVVDGVHGSALVSYNAGISACEKGMQWQRALSLISEMWEAKVVPEAISFSAGIRACDRAGQGLQAIWWLTATRDAKLESNVASFSDALVLAIRK
ncbi:unnamed protein product [Prorocentrum cordatum]|uniref:Pentatricopeptide repeat-containing protein n=1 Tax=Prorocentrum cordatum TaxID=2364126 RepID=A0ABN9TF37_9DINO|nr:unnamed protein product [Polarella glacialis]